MEKIVYTIGEVARAIGESVSLVRYWSDSFPKFIRPRRNAKGNRLFSPADLETFHQIHHLVKEKGLSLDGAARQLAADRDTVGAKVRVLSSLKAIRAQLVEIKNGL